MGSRTRAAARGCQENQEFRAGRERPCRKSPQKTGQSIGAGLGTSQMNHNHESSARTIVAACSAVRLA